MNGASGQAAFAGGAAWTGRADPPMTGPGAWTATGRRDGLGARA
jgi:hypothetical protein